MNPEEKMNPEKKVAVILAVLTGAAEDAGLPEARAKAVYDELVERYKMMDEGLAPAMLDKIKKILEG